MSGRELFNREMGWKGGGGKMKRTFIVKLFKVVDFVLVFIVAVVAGAQLGSSRMSVRCPNPPSPKVS